MVIDFSIKYIEQFMYFFNRKDPLKKKIEKCYGFNLYYECLSTDSI